MGGGNLLKSMGLCDPAGGFRSTEFYGKWAVREMEERKTGRMG